MIHILWSLTAERDLARIQSFHAERSVTFADRVRRRLLERALSLAEAPRQGRARAASGVRAISLPDIQYVLTYRHLRDRIVIVGIRHTRQDGD